MNLAYLQPMAPEIILAISSMILLVFGVFVKSNYSVGIITFLSTAILILVALMLAVSLPNVDGGVVLFDMYVSNGFVNTSKIIIVLCSLTSLLLSYSWLNNTVEAKAEYPVLILLATLGLMLMISAHSLLAFYVALELGSLTMYVMACYDRNALKSSEAGLKYFVLGSLASGMLLFGISLIYGFSGTLEFDALRALLSGDQSVSYGIVIGLVFVLVAFCFKISAVPFHMWTPDVYEGAPTPVVAFFATVPKIAVLCFVARLLIDVFGSISSYWQQVLMAASVASMVVGALGALPQNNIKRIIAYSSIGHVGYVLLAIIAGTPKAIEAMLLYLVIYAITTFGVFACLLLLKKDDKPLTHLDDLRGLSASHPKISAALALLMFSLAGIPPFIGFFGKMFLFAAALEAGHVFLVVVAALSSVIACFYYIRIVKVMYFDEQVSEPDHVSRKSLAGFVLVLSLLSNICLFFPAIIMQPLEAVASLLS